MYDSFRQCQRRIWGGAMGVFVIPWNSKNILEEWNRSHDKVISINQFRIGRGGKKQKEVSRYVRKNTASVPKTESWPRQHWTLQ